MRDDSSLPEVTPLPAALPLPEYYMEAGEVERMEIEYSDRSPGDYVISGPLRESADGASQPTGRYFPSWERAEWWARQKFGARFLGPVKELVQHPDAGRWGFLVRRADSV